MSNPTPETTVKPVSEPTQFPRLSRWLDMFDEVMGINTKPRTEEH